MARHPDAEQAPAAPERRPTLSNQLLNWFGIGGARGEPSRDNTTQPLPEFPVSTAAPTLPLHMAERYQIIRALGRGASGIVYQARDLRIGRIIAVKLLYQKVPEGSLTHRRFLQEARIAGQVENPNIVTIYDVEDSVPGILMEYLGGGNLSARLKTRQLIAEETAMKILRGILNGLDSAHSIGVVHRDIKPQNILFDQYGNPKISDFGIAHLPVESGGLSDAEANQVAGTPNYMAPEQMIFGGRIDGRADLYSVGIMGFEMLVGDRPYRTAGAQHIYEIREIVDRTPMPTATDFPPDISESTRSVILRLMQRDPARRYRNAEEAIRAIDDSLAEIVSIQQVGKVSRQRVNTRVEMYEDILRMFLVDGVVSLPERRELVKRARRLGVRDTVARKSEEKIRSELGLPLLKDLQIYEDRAMELLSDLDFSDEDRQVLRDLGNELNITDIEQRKIEEAAMDRLQMKKSGRDEPDTQPPV